MTKFYRQKLPPETHLLPPSRKRPVHPFVHWVWTTINDQGKSQQDIAEASGVSASTLRRWRAGEREPSLAAIEAVANALGYSIVLRRRGGAE